MDCFTKSALETELRKGVLNYSQLGKLHGIDRSTVRNYAKRLGIHPGNKHRLKTHSLDLTYFTCIDTSSKAYVLGFIYADGCNTRKGLQIGIQECDKDVLEFIQTELRVSNPLRYVKPYKANWHPKYELEIRSMELSQQLTSLGCPPAKSKTLTFPTFLSFHLLPHFIRGYFDGDGSLTYNKGSWRISFTSASKAFIEPLQSYLTTQGISLNFYTNAKNGCYSLQSSKQTVVRKLVAFLYTKPDFGMSRKKAAALMCMSSEKGER